MDPEANLTEQLSLANQILEAWDHCNEDGTLPQEEAARVADLANELAELVEALNGWITKGGFLPKRWQVQR